MPAGSPGRRQSDQAFTSAGLYRRVAFETMSTDFMLALVTRGLGVCLLPAPCVHASPDLRTLPVTDGPHRVEHLAWDRFNPTPAATAFTRQITEAPSTRPPKSGTAAQ